METQKADAIIDLREALDILGVSRTTFYRWMKEERISGKKAGGQWRFYRDDIYRLLEDPHREKDEVIIGHLDEALGIYSGLLNSISTGRKRAGDLTPLYLSEAAEPQSEDTGTMRPPRRLLDMILTKGVLEEASDIHIEPYGSRIRIRHRDTGTLFQVADLPGEVLPLLVREIKGLAGCSPGHTWSTQTGTIPFRVAERDVLSRVSFFPCVEGESVEIKLLDKSTSIPPVKDLGLNSKDARKLMKSINSSSGIIIFTGPKECGKTTALYSCLQEINSEKRNIMTVEDPVEMSFQGINQSQIDPERGYTMHDAVRGMLRHDPDVIAISEIRDLETMELAVGSSITGHLVFTVLHATDTSAAIQRLLDIGIEPFLINDAVTHIISPRVVRKICESCREEIPADRDLSRKISYGSHKVKEMVYRGRGCPNCHGSGYKGRTALYEVLTFTEALNQVVLSKSPLSDMRKAVYELGINTLKSEAIRFVNDGVTSLEEVYGVLDPGGKWR